MGEPSGQGGARLRRLAGVFQEAGFEPELTDRAFAWLWSVHATLAVLVTAAMAAGSAAAYAKSPDLVERSHEAAREALEVVKARGARAPGLEPQGDSSSPLWLASPLLRQGYSEEDFEFLLDALLANAREEAVGRLLEVFEAGRRRASSECLG